MLLKLSYLTKEIFFLPTHYKPGKHVIKNSNPILLKLQCKSAELLLSEVLHSTLEKLFVSTSLWLW